MDFSGDLPIPITTSRSDLAWLFEISWATFPQAGQIGLCSVRNWGTFESAPNWACHVHNYTNIHIFQCDFCIIFFFPPTNWPTLLFTGDVPVGQLKSIIYAHFSCQILPCSCLLFYRTSMSSCTSVSWMGSSLLQRMAGWSWSILLSMKTSWLCRIMRSPVCERLGYLL